MNKYIGTGVGVIVIKDEKILLLRRKKVHGDGTWSTPGGHIEFGESFENCAVREVWEETNINISNPTFHAVTNDYFKTEEKHYLTVWMKADYVSGEPIVSASYEADKVEWVSLNNLPTNLFLPFKNLLDGKTYPRKEGKFFTV